MGKGIYLDYATTTPLDKSVERAIKPFWSKQFGNASSLHAEGVGARKALETARLSVARNLQAHASEIVFTSGGTEGNNLAIIGFFGALEKTGKKLSELHAITTVIEHSSVKNCFKALEQRGLHVSWAPVGSDGVVRFQTIEKLIIPQTVLISVMYANNEIGALQPISRIGALLKKANEHRGERPSVEAIEELGRRNTEHSSANVGSTEPTKANVRKIFFHTDACQAPLYLDVSQNHLRADLITLDGHKMYGPKGVGALYVRRGTPLSSLFFGGEQERELRAGTEPLPLIVGFAEALFSAQVRRKKESMKITKLRDFFFESLAREIPGVRINGSLTDRLPNNVNLSIPGLNAEFAVLQLDARGIFCSAKSACLEGGDESYVVKALGRNDGSERSSLRFSLGRSTAKGHIRKAARLLKEVVAMQLRP